MEPKYDGMRVAIVKKGDEIVIYGRSWDEYTAHVPHIVEDLRKIDRDFHLDGELAFTSSHVSVHQSLSEGAFERGDVLSVDFNQTMRIMGSLPAKAIQKQKDVGYVRFIAFDLLEIDGKDVTEFEDENRRGLMLRLLDSERFGRFIEPISRWSKVSQKLYDDLLSAGAEGAMLKNSKAPYLEKRSSKTWYKVKKVDTFDVVIMGSYEGSGKHVGRLGGLVFGTYNEGQLQRIGKAGGGFTDVEREQLWATREEVVGQVIEIQANDLVGSKEIRTPRHPQFIRFRDDKGPIECLSEQFRVS